MEYSGVEGDGQLRVCVEILTTAESSEYNVIVDLEVVDGAKTGTHCTGPMPLYKQPNGMNVSRYSCVSVHYFVH